MGLEPEVLGEGVGGGMQGERAGHAFQDYSDCGAVRFIDEGPVSFVLGPAGDVLCWTDVLLLILH